MTYNYFGKEVEVIRTTDGGVSQLADGSWVSTSLLVAASTKNIKAATAAASKMKGGENA